MASSTNFLPLLATILPLLTLSSAWSVSFFTGSDCSGDYTSCTGMGEFHDQWTYCNTPGYPNGDCVWHANNGAGNNPYPHLPCTND